VRAACRRAGPPAPLPAGFAHPAPPPAHPRPPRRELFNDKIGAGEATEELKKLASSIIESATAEDATKKLQKQVAEAEAATAAPAAVPENVAEARQWIDAYKARSEAKETVSVSA
jgi:hypothetical protein